MSYYLHNVPGRLRVKSPLLKRNSDAGEELKKALSTIQGIATVDFNPVTGSLLVNYNHRTTKQEDIISLLERKGYFDRGRATTNEDYIHVAAEKTGRLVGKAVLGIAIDKALEGTALSLIGLLI
ncbi:MAG TPA: cation transporter [Thermodesulfovibrionales bacterium]|jgi:geranylgeranyl pyrophosphate synthase|nr:cation transporter [Thermodesulfovibrionales bacterium]